MQLTGSVGDGGANAVHDVALVKFLLMKAKGPTGGAYLPTGDYADVRDDNYRAAIKVFQDDNHLLEKASEKPKPGAPKPEVARLVTPGGATWQKLAATLAADFKNVRVEKGVGLIYFPMTEGALSPAMSEVEKSTLRTPFKLNVLDLMRKFHTESGIAMTVNPNGLRRTFEEQTKNSGTEAAPGETIHNYGYAVDLGFTGLSYVSRAGTTQVVDRLDRGFDKWPRIKEQLFGARNVIVRRDRKLFGTDALGGGDLFHLQHFPDNDLDSVTSFMQLLEKVGPMKMKWRPEFKTWTDYWCDLGLGGEKYYVGSALDIWKPDRTLMLSKEDLAKALSAKLKADRTFLPDKYLVPRPKSTGGTGADTPRTLSPSEITDPDIARVKALLRDEFVAADKAWEQWKDVNYNGNSPPLNPKNPKNKNKIGH